MTTNEDVTRAVADIVARQIEAEAGTDEAKSRELRQHAEALRKQAAELEAKAIATDANAEQWELGSRMKRQLVALMGGAAEIPTAEQVLPVGELGMSIGLLPLTLPPNPSPETVAAYRDLMQKLNTETLTQATRASQLLRGMQSTLSTAQLPPEFVPAPDPLTAPPSQDSGPQPILPAPPAWPDLIGQRLALDIGETEPMVGRLTAVDPERLTVEVDAGTHAGETVRVDIAGVRDWQALPEPPADTAPAAGWEPVGYPERPAVEAPASGPVGETAAQQRSAALMTELKQAGAKIGVRVPAKHEFEPPAPLPQRERKADYAPVPLGPAAAEACGQVLEALTATEQANDDQPERLIDPDCRDGKCGSCVGGPCEHECHRAQVGGDTSCPECLAPMPGDHNPDCPQAARVAAALDAQFGTAAQDEREEAAAPGRFQPETGADPDRAGAVDDGERAGADSPAPGPTRSDVTATEQDGDGRG